MVNTPGYFLEGLLGLIPLNLTVFEPSVKMTGKIRIGIPPLVNTVLFYEIIPKLILENPSIQYYIIETGAFQLQKSLILNEIDIAVLLRPTNHNKNKIKESIKPNIKIKSHNWDFLINAVENANIITILPSPVSKFCSLGKLINVKFSDPINWEVILCRQNKHHYTRVEDYIFSYIYYILYHLACS